MASVAPGQDARWPRRRTGVIVVSGALYVGSARAALEALQDDRSWNWGVVLLYGGLWAITMAVVFLVLRVVRRRDPDRLQGRALVEAALRTGRLPEGLAPGPWRRALMEESNSNRQSRWAVGVSGLGIAGLVGLAAVVDSDPAVGLLVLVLVAVVVLLDRWCAREVRRADGLLARLDAAA